jgi:hypothetical protein
LRRRLRGAAEPLRDRLRGDRRRPERGEPDADDRVRDREDRDRDRRRRGDGPPSEPASDGLGFVRASRSLAAIFA